MSPDEARGFFESKLPKRAADKKLSILAFYKAAKTLDSEADINAFFEGHVYWLQSTLPRPIADATAAARANVNWCLCEGLPKAQLPLWEKLLDRHVVPQAPSAKDLAKAALAKLKGRP